MKLYNPYLRSITVLGMAIILITGSCNKTEEEEEGNIVEVLSANSELSTLVAAMQKAELISVLEEYNPLTVFAPTNTSFDQLFNGLGVNGLEDLSPDFLDSILYYHILFGELSSTFFATGYLSTLRGGPDLQAVILHMNDSDSTLNGDVQISEFDIMASNGVIHLIDKVLDPPLVLDIARQNGLFTQFVDAVGMAEMDSILNETGPYTVFAPTDEAFETFFTSMGISELSELTKEQLTLLIQGHIVNGNLRSTDLVIGDLSTLNGDILIDINTYIFINTYTTVTAIDLQGTNGVLHIIDRVLIPDGQ